MPAWGWALVALGIAFVGSALALCVPVDVRFHAARPSEASARVRLEWLWGLAGFTVAGRTGTPASAPHRPATVREGRARGRKGPRPSMPDLGFVLGALGTARRMMRAVQIRRLHVRVVFGSADPAETGFAYAAALPLLAVLSSVVPNTDAAVEPDFGGARLEYEVDGWVRVVPIRAALPALWFMLRPSTIGSLARMRSAPS